MREDRARTSLIATLLVAVWAIVLLSAPAVAQTVGRVTVLQPTHTAGGAKRLALVIGNAAYQTSPFSKIRSTSRARLPNGCATSDTESTSPWTSIAAR
jgi:hypothetical protein